MTIDCPDALDDGKGLAELGEGAAGGDLLALNIREGGNGVLVTALVRKSSLASRWASSG